MATFVVLKVLDVEGDQVEMARVMPNEKANARLSDVLERSAPEEGNYVVVRTDNLEKMRAVTRTVVE